MHLRALRAGDRSRVLSAVDEQLRQQPTVKTRNRKPMEPGSWAPYELRVQPFRVYYDVVEDESDPVVIVLAVGVKDRDQVTIGGEVVIP